MRYRVAFAKRFQSDGNESVLNPTSEVDIDIPDEVVADKVFVGRFEPESKHSQEVLDEDDAFLGAAAPELWEYDIVDGREQDFIDALRNSETVMEFSVVDETVTDVDDLSFSNLDDVEESVSGNGSVDDGPGGQVTGDATAGGMADSAIYTSRSETQAAFADGGGSGSGGIDDLTVVSADDPSLGLTNYGGKEAEDWAADTGPTKSATAGVGSGKHK